MIKIIHSSNLSKEKIISKGSNNIIAPTVGEIIYILKNGCTICLKTLIYVFRKTEHVSVWVIFHPKGIILMGPANFPQRESSFITLVAGADN